MSTISAFADELVKIAAEFSINTSNPRKLEEFRQLGLKPSRISNYDLREPDADSHTIIRYKASQLPERTLVDDTALDVAGADVGTKVKWELDSLNRYAGRDAMFRTVLGIRDGKHVKIYEGAIPGKIVKPSHIRKSGFGFDEVFQPTGSDKTLSEHKPNEFNARAIAVSNFLKDKPTKIAPPLHTYAGQFQPTK